jgi:hypothetical protein
MIEPKNMMAIYQKWYLTGLGLNPSDETKVPLDVGCDDTQELEVPLHA